MRRMPNIRSLEATMSTRKSTSTDAILPMTADYMEQIVRREKTYEFRRYLISSCVQRIWFYLNAPHSHIRYICAIDPARTRNAEDEPLPEDGAGNHEFNTRHEDWDKYDYAYRILDVREISPPIPLSDLKAIYGMKGAPRGLVYVPPTLVNGCKVEEQQLLWSAEMKVEDIITVQPNLPDPEKRKRAGSEVTTNIKKTRR